MTSGLLCELDHLNAAATFAFCFAAILELYVSFPSFSSNAGYLDWFGNLSEGPIGSRPDDRAVT